MKTDFVQRTVLGYYPNSTFRILKKYKSFVTENAEHLDKLTAFMDVLNGDTIYELRFRSSDDYTGFSIGSYGNYQKISVPTPFDMNEMASHLGNEALKKDIRILLHANLLKS